MRLPFGEALTARTGLSGWHSLPDISIAVRRLTAASSLSNPAFLDAIDVR